MVTIQKLKQMGIEPWLLSGDNSRVARAIGHQVFLFYLKLPFKLGISKVIGGVLPDQKSLKIKELQVQVLLSVKLTF